MLPLNGLGVIGVRGPQVRTAVRPSGAMQGAEISLGFDDEVNTLTGIALRQRVSQAGAGVLRGRCNNMAEDCAGILETHQA